MAFSCGWEVGPFGKKPGFSPIPEFLSCTQGENMKIRSRSLRLKDKHFPLLSAPGLTDWPAKQTRVSVSDGEVIILSLFFSRTSAQTDISPFVENVRSRDLAIADCSLKSSDAENSIIRFFLRHGLRSHSWQKTRPSSIMASNVLWQGMFQREKTIWQLGSGFSADLKIW